MVGEDGEGMPGPTQVVPPMGEGFHHSKQLSFIDVVVTLSGGKGSGVVCNGMEFGFPFLFRGGVSFASLLGKYSSDPICGGVGL